MAVLGDVERARARGWCWLWWCVCGEGERERGREPQHSSYMRRSAPCLFSVPGSGELVQPRVLSLAA